MTTSLPILNPAPLLSPLPADTSAATTYTDINGLAELKRDQIRSAGPDFYAAKKVEFPLKASVEPLPG